MIVRILVSGFNKDIFHGFAGAARVGLLRALSLQFLLCAGERLFSASSGAILEECPSQEETGFRLFCKLNNLNNLINLNNLNKPNEKVVRIGRTSLAGWPPLRRVSELAS